MGTLLIRERYKIVRTVYKQRDHAAVEAVDIQDRETPMCLLNLYEGALLHSYGKVYSRLEPESCRAFQGAFLERGALVSVFRLSSGVPVDRVFFKGDGWDWRDRLYYAEELLHTALLLSDLPAEISCAAMLSDNLLFDLEDRKISPRFLIRPMEGMNGRELVLLTQDQLRKVLPPRLSRPAAEQAFFDLVDRSAFSSMVPLYSRWREIEPDIRAGYEEYEQKNIIQRAFWLIGRWFASRKRGG